MDKKILVSELVILHELRLAIPKRVLVPFAALVGAEPLLTNTALSMNDGFMGRCPKLLDFKMNYLGRCLEHLPTPIWRRAYELALG